MKLETLKDLFHHELKDLYSAEKQIIDALPKMIEGASNADLKTALRDHLELTREHLARIEDVCEELDLKPGGHKCKGMEGLIEEGSELLKEKTEKNVLDAGIIGAAQRVEHYEMAAYGTARTHAAKLGFHDVADKLQGTLDEEGEADRLLSRLAERSINFEALVT